jgi:hypothetical protein
MTHSSPKSESKTNLESIESAGKTVLLRIYQSFDYGWSYAFLARLEKDPNCPSG